MIDYLLDMSTYLEYSNMIFWKILAELFSEVDIVVTVRLVSYLFAKFEVFLVQKLSFTELGKFSQNALAAI